MSPGLPEGGGVRAFSRQGRDTEKGESTIRSWILTNSKR